MNRQNVLFRENKQAFIEIQFWRQNIRRTYSTDIFV